MTDLVQKLVGALDDCLDRIEKSEFWWMDCPDRGGFDAEAIRAALSEAKAGGWVLPDGKRAIVVDDSFDQLIYWVDRTVSKGNANTDIQEAYEAWTGWDTYPLPAPSAQRGEG